MNNNTVYMCLVFNRDGVNKELYKAKKEASWSETQSRIEGFPFAPDMEINGRKVSVSDESGDYLTIHLGGDMVAELEIRSSKDEIPEIEGLPDDLDGFVTANFSEAVVLSGADFEKLKALVKEVGAVLTYRKLYTPFVN